MTDRRIKVGILGYGLAGRVFHVPLLSAVPDFDIKAIWSSRHAEIQALGRGIATANCAEDVIGDDEIELVVIATPSATHTALAGQALLAGKHVIVDKPIALTVGDAISLANLSISQDRKLFAFHNRRWDSDFLAIRDAVEKNLAGHVKHFESHFDRFRPNVVDRWRENDEEGAGVWFDLGPHIVDQALLLFGKPDAITANIASLRTGGRADDWAHVVLHYPHMRAILHASLITPDGASGGHPRFLVGGDGGTLVKRCADMLEQQLTQGLRPGDSAFGFDEDKLELHRSGLPVEFLDSPIGQQHRFYELAAESIRRGSAAPVSLNDMIDVCEVIEVAKISAAKRMTVDLSGYRDKVLADISHA